MPPIAVTEFQDALSELAARSGEATDKLLSRISVLSPAEARAFITDAYPALLDPFLRASSDLTAQWYAEQPTLPVAPGAAEYTPIPAPMRSGEQLAISGRWALTTSTPATALRGNATRQVMNQSRDTVIINAEREGKRWIRQAKPNACGFCKMLATRATKEWRKYSYGGEGVRRKLDRDGNITNDYTLVVIGKRGRKRRKNGRSLGSEYHDHCRCVAVAIRDGEYEPPDYVQQWTEQYDTIVAEHGTGDLLKISNLMDEGRIRPDRIKTPPLDGAADLFTAAATQPPPVDLDAAPPTAPVPQRTVDDVAADLNAAIEAGDDALIEQLAQELDDIDAAERKAVARRARAKERRTAATNAKWAQVEDMIDAGADPLEAEAEVFGKQLSRLRNRELKWQLKTEGYHGETINQLIRDKYLTMLNEHMLAAENATNGYMLKEKYQNRVKPVLLWTAGEKRARELMTDEMAEWFDQHGRITLKAVRESTLNGTGVWRDAMQEDFLR